MNIGIVVEGPDDAAVYSTLVTRIDAGITRVHCRECGGRHKLKNKFTYFLREFSRNPAAFDIARALVIRDSDCSDPVPIERELAELFAKSRFQPGFRVSFHATKCKLESWLIADEVAINTVSVKRGGPGGIVKVNQDLESFREADELYTKILSHAGLQDTNAVMKEIAREVRLEVVAERCPRFRDFQRKVMEEH